MKNLQSYQEDRQTALFDQTGAFFAFSNEQFNEKSQKGTKYVNCRHGMFCPKEHFDTLFDGLDTILKKAIQQDIKENGKDAIIRRELINYESFYTMDYSDAFAALKPYGFTEADVKAVFNKECMAIDWDTY